MSVITESLLSDGAFPFRLHRFTVEQYHRLGDLGVLSPEDKVELLEGWIVEKMNQRPAHGFAVGILNQWLVSSLPGGWIGRCQLPITLSTSEPEPDLAIVRGTHRDYRERHPGGAECRLVIEVADTSVAKDLAKSSIYASAGVEEYWIFNLADKTLIRQTEPQESKYFRSTSLRAGDGDIEIVIGQQTIRFRLADVLGE